MSNKVLIVDDSGLARRMTRQMLEEFGYETEEAQDGSEALERYVLHRHDLVLLDMVMHGMYGLEVLQKLKELNPALPVVIITADIQKSTREQVRAAGAAGVVNKPLNKQELEQVVKTVLAGGAAWN